jgi:hypothetical protein
MIIPGFPSPNKENESLLEEHKEVNEHDDSILSETSFLHSIRENDESVVSSVNIPMNEIKVSETRIVSFQ